VPEGSETAEAAPESAVATLAARFKQTLGDKVTMVRASSRLTTSPVCIVAADLGMDRQLEKILSAHEQLKTRTAPVLELNPTHPLIKALAAKATSGGANEAIDDAAVLLYGEARILDGEPPEDPADFSARIGRLIERGLG
jgi:molecular chaperone HtpG